MKKKGLIVIGVVFFILIIDQLVKIWVKTSFDYQETQSLIDGFIQLRYIENRGMAFGSTLGDGALPKYVLSLFRFVACIAIAFYIRSLIKKPNIKMGFLIALGLIFSGALGNLIDGMFYDFFFELDDSVLTNLMEDPEFKGQFLTDDKGEFIMRESGFLLGSVVDMFQFTARWPEWMPYVGGGDIFPPIFNVADVAISSGVGLIILKQKSFFPRENNSSWSLFKKKKVAVSDEETIVEEVTSESNIEEVVEDKLQENS